MARHALLDLDPNPSYSDHAPMFEQITHDISVQVHPTYIAEHSSPENGHYFFAYQVTIQNRSLRSLKLMRRHWIICDAHGQVEEVEGDGVVGQQPDLEPGGTFQYTSFCPLPTPTGSMRGTYYFEDSQGNTVEAAIPLFILCEPSHYH